MIRTPWKGRIALQAGNHDPDHLVEKQLKVFFFCCCWEGVGLNEDKSMNQMVWVHSCACSLPLNRCTLSPGWVQGQHRQDSRSMSSARNSNLPGRAQLSERCQTTDKWQYAATKRSLRSVRTVVQFSLCNNFASLHFTDIPLSLAPFFWFEFISFFLHSSRHIHLIGNRMWSKKKHADVPWALHTVQSRLASSCAPHRSAGSPTSVEGDVALNTLSQTHPWLALSTHFIIVLTGFRSLCAYPWLCT